MNSKRAKDLVPGDVMLLADGGRYRVTSLQPGAERGNVVVHFAVSNPSGSDWFASGKRDYITVV